MPDATSKKFTPRVKFDGLIKAQIFIIRPNDGQPRGGGMMFTLLPRKILKVPLIIKRLFTPMICGKKANKKHS
jgi:hypothetical protein